MIPVVRAACSRWPGGANPFEQRIGRPKQPCRLAHVARRDRNPGHTVQTLDHTGEVADLLDQADPFPELLR